MLIKSQLVTQVSGSIGGLTGSRNAGGMYFRARGLPTNPNTSRQQAVRNAVSLLATRYVEELSPSQRESWRLYAANVPLVGPLGDPRDIGPMPMYVRCNVPRIQAGLDIVDDGPTIFDQGPAVLTTANPTYQLADPGVTPSQVSIPFDTAESWPNQDDSALLVYMSRPQNPSIERYHGPYRYVGAIEGADSDGPTPPAVLTNLPYEPAPDQHIWFRLRVTLADGRLSPTIVQLGTMGV